jgi:hypothetical protein
MAEEIRPNLNKSRGDVVIGFPDLLKGNAGNSATSDPITMKRAEEGQSFGGSGSGGGGGMSNNVTPILGDLQAASELSMEELAKQTDILEGIEKNTSETTTAGGQEKKSSEEDIRAKLDESKPLDQEQGNKIIDKLAELNSNSKATASLLSVAAAFAGTQADEITDAIDNMTTTQKAVAAALTVGVAGTSIAASKLVTAPLKKIVSPDKKEKPKPNSSKSKKPKTAKPKPPPSPAKPKSGVVKQAAKTGGKLIAKQGAKVATIAASGPAAPIVASVMAAATVYELGTMALEKAGYGEEVEAFETGAMNLAGIETDEQEIEKDAAKVALNEKKMQALVKKIDSSDLTDQQKTFQKAELQKALNNSGDVDTFGDRKARIADRTFKRYEKMYGEVEIESPMTPPPQSSNSIESETSQAREAELLAMIPDIQIPPQIPPTVNVPNQPAPNVSVSAVLPRTNLPSELSSFGNQARIPKLVVS